MKQLLFPLYLCLLSLSSACSTLSESISSSESTAKYEKTRGENGETVYRRTRVLSPEPAETPESERFDRPIYVAPVDLPTSNPSSSPYVASSLPPSSADLQNLEKMRAEERRALIADAADSPNVLTEVYLPLEFNAGNGHGHIGVGLGFELLSILDLKGGISLFSGREIYSGFDAAARLKYKIGFVTPFVGIGGYAGDSKNCSTKGLVELCEKRFLFAGYTEMGLGLGGFHFNYRRYAIEDAGIELPVSTLWGVGYNLQF